MFSKETNLPDFFISCDWGTSNFRLRLISTKNQAIMAELSNDCGAKTVSQQSGVPTGGDPERSLFATILLQGVDQLCEKVEASESSIPVVVSGMASSSIGWVELPYAILPFPLDGSAAVTKKMSLRTSQGRALSVLLISGVQSDDDVMRGEETEILGFFSGEKCHGSSTEGWLVLPGTHSKHVCLEKGRLVAFRTFLTGELFDLLRHHSILSASVTSASNSLDGASEGFFCDGLTAARDLGWSSGLFSVRTNTLLKQFSTEQNTAFLSGLLIGSEVMDSPAVRANPSHPIYLDGRTHLSSFYHKAFSFLHPTRTIIFLGQEEGLPPVVLGHMRLLSQGANLSCGE
ncbi:MAG: 2-dehydro-3-deoxygalactonokinase [Opitutaceae bacterium]|nr:2-dehydro-3-deoxygalactonokinase [Opitutaceae bacterium]